MGIGGGGGGGNGWGASASGGGEDSNGLDVARFDLFSSILPLVDYAIEPSIVVHLSHYV
jgi:hypothetical protein